MKREERSRRKFGPLQCLTLECVYPLVFEGHFAAIELELGAVAITKKILSSNPNSIMIMVHF